MAKKKSILSGLSGSSKAVLIAIPLIAVGIIAVGPLLIPNFPIDVYGIINPPFEEPSDLTIQELQQNEEVIFLTGELTCGGGGTGDVISNDFPFSNDPCIPSDVILLTEDPTLEEPIMEIQEMVTDPPPTNQTEFSEDPPIEQICDTDPSNILCQVAGEPTTAIILTSKVEKISSSGIREFVSGEFGLNQLAFFVEESTNIDYANGRLIFELGTKSDRPNHEYSARSLDATQAGLMGCTNPTFQECIAKFDILISDQSIFTEPLELGIDRTGDDQGVARLIFLSGVGSTVETGSTTFTFNFADHFDKFGNEQITRIKGVVTELNIAEALTFPEQLPSDVIQFSTTDQQVFAMEIARDNEQIIITDDNTNATSRVFPTDSRIVISTITTNIPGTYCLIAQQLSRQLLPLEGCFARNLSCPCLGSTIGIGTNNVLAGTTLAPTVSGIILLDQDGQLLATDPGGSGSSIFSELVTRNANYTIITSVPEITSGFMSFGKSQETQSYTCNSPGTARHKITSVWVGDQCGRIGSCNFYWYIATDGISTGATQCNFP